MNRGKLKDFGLITVGILFVAISVAYFFEPNNIAAGGITGLAIVINHYIPFISVGPLVLIMDSVLFPNIVFLITVLARLCRRIVPLKRPNLQFSIKIVGLADKFSAISPSSAPFISLSKVNINCSFSLSRETSSIK